MHSDTERLNACVRRAANEILSQVNLLLLDVEQQTGKSHMEFRLRAVEQLAKETLRAVEHEKGHLRAG